MNKSSAGIASCSFGKIRSSATLTGEEILYVTPVTAIGSLSSISLQVTTYQVANLLNLVGNEILYVVPVTVLGIDPFPIPVTTSEVSNLTGLTGNEILYVNGLSSYDTRSASNTRITTSQIASLKNQE